MFQSKGFTGNLVCILGFQKRILCVYFNFFVAVVYKGFQVKFLCPVVSLNTYLISHLKSQLVKFPFSQFLFHHILNQNPLIQFLKQFRT